MNENATKTALITGASRGLGLALSRALAARGWTLIIDARGAEALETAREELAQLSRVVAIPGSVIDPEHRRALAEAAREAGGLDALVNNASILGPSPRPALLDYPLDVLEDVYRANAVAPLAVIQAVRRELKPGARVLNVTSDAAVDPYEGWGGYGSSKAALEQLSAILAAENPELRVYHADPGDMRTRMHEEAFPGEDISDRPLPEESVPGMIWLLEGDLPSGRYRARDLAENLAGDEANDATEFRIALTVDDFDGAAGFYGAALGMPLVEQWNRADGRGAIFAAGPTTVEILDRPQAERVDEIEAGERISGPVRFAVKVPDLQTAAAALERAGATAVGEPVSTPWGDFNQRMLTPDGVQLTLFQAGTATPADREMV